MEVEAKPIVPAPAKPGDQLNVVEAINSAASTRSAKGLREVVAIAFWLYVKLKASMGFVLGYLTRNLK